jgi:hypothetical protein
MTTIQTYLQKGVYIGTTALVAEPRPAFVPYTPAGQETLEKFRAAVLAPTIQFIPKQFKKQK